MQIDQPSWRKPAGMGLILLLIVVWAVIVVSASGLVEGGHWLIQAIYYTVAGIVWILPLKPLLRWMETGSFQRQVSSEDNT